MSLDVISQIGISVFAVIGIILMSYNKNEIGGYIALIGQPFWFYTGIVHKQTGVLIASVLFTGAYILNIYKGRKRRKT